MTNDISELIQRVREKPGMYIGNYSVVAFGHFLGGYRCARYDAGALAFSDAMHGFQEKVQERYSVTLSINWANILAFAFQSEARGLDMFWEMWDEHLSEAAESDTETEEGIPLAT